MCVRRCDRSVETGVTFVVVVVVAGGDDRSTKAAHRRYSLMQHRLLHPSPSLSPYAIKRLTLSALIKATTSAVANCNLATLTLGLLKMVSNNACLSALIRWSGPLCLTHAGHQSGLPASPLL